MSISKGLSGSLHLNFELLSNRIIKPQQSIRFRSTYKKKMSDIFFGTTTTLNRFSFLRTNTEFIKEIVQTPKISTRLVFFKQTGNNSISPYLIDNSDGGYSMLNLQLSETPDFLKSLMVDWSKNNSVQAVSTRDELTCVFLGIDENDSTNENNFLTSENSVSESLTVFPSGYTFNADLKDIDYEGKYKGVPYIAIDVTKSTRLIEYLELFEKVSAVESIMDLLKLSKIEASLFAYSKMYLDWLMRNQCCPGCGSKVVPTDAGTKLLCVSSADAKCPVKSTHVNNVCFPRTDPVIIIGIISSDGKKILLGHNKRHGKFSKDGKVMYSCVAGFMEPGETIEECSIREIWEETGCKASKIKILSSQPWPFPSSLMIGCVGVVEFNNDNELIDLDFDKELDDCKWFDIEEITTIVEGGVITDEASPLSNVHLPMPNSIAFELIKKVTKNDY